MPFLAVEKEMDHHVVPAQPGHSNNNLLRLNPYHTSTSSYINVESLEDHGLTIAIEKWQCQTMQEKSYKSEASKTNFQNGLWIKSAIHSRGPLPPVQETLYQPGGSQKVQAWAP
jgi:hypothetical protein